MSLDLVIRGGRIIDGSGNASYSADLGVRDGRIVEIGAINSSGRREIDAAGLAVTPGFIDGHTHMDAQVNWDPLGTCSSWHGVTTVVMGNCGFSIAPVRRGQEHLVVRNLERAEDLSPAAMAAGIDWRWEGFSEYLDVLEALPMGIDYAANVGHSALRTWAMGERALTEAANEDDLQLMEAELRRGLAAGAVGLSTSRSYHHLMSDGRPVASRAADWSELTRLASAVGDHQAILEMALDAEAHDADPQVRKAFYDKLIELAVEQRAAVTFGVIAAGDPDRWRAQLQTFEAAAARGGRMFGQSHSRGVSIVSSFLTQLPFDRLPEWGRLRARPIAEQKRLLRDPELRRVLVEEARTGDYGHAFGAEARKPDWSLVRVYDGPMPPHRLVADIAAERGVDPVEAMIDLALDNDFQTFFFATSSPVSEDGLLEVMRHPQTVMTFSDSGAHVSQIVDACIHLHLLSYWSLARGDFSIEQAVAMITRAPARAWGFHDRGELREGMKADINILDLGRLSPGTPELVRDLPADAERLIMKPSGVSAVFVAGEQLFADGEHTGALPGRLIRKSAH
jgi:N-acyl-D-amino-acid deacylase